MISSLSKGRATCSDYICAGCRPQSILFSSSGLNSNLVQSKKLSSEEKDVRHKRPQDPSNSPPEDIEQDYAVRSPVTNDAKEPASSHSIRDYLGALGSRLFGRQSNTDPRKESVNPILDTVFDKRDISESKNTPRYFEGQPDTDTQPEPGLDIPRKIGELHRALSEQQESAPTAARSNLRRSKSSSVKSRVKPDAREFTGVRKPPKTTKRDQAGGAARSSRPAKQRKPTRVKTSISANKSLIDALTTTTDEESGEAIHTATAQDHGLVSVPVGSNCVPSLAHGLSRVLFNPGVYQLQDPRSRVYNFDPYLEQIMPATQFNFDALKHFVTSSEDLTLRDIATRIDQRYSGSSSSMTATLVHFHYLLSQWRPLDCGIQTQSFPIVSKKPTRIERAPAAIFLKWRDGRYAIDPDKQFSSGNILMMLGKMMEKMLTLGKADFERYRLSNPEQISPEERATPEAFHYTAAGKFLMRSQLDACDKRLPGTGMFDLKTRAVVAVRMDAKNYMTGRDYEIRYRHGEYESFEREYFDMIRSAFLKYSLQVRMGRMDGVFVAYHNTQRIFGFQYISLQEMDKALHGQQNRALGDREFSLSLELLEKVLDKATAKYPNTSLRLHFETRESRETMMYLFAEPVTDQQIADIQASDAAKMENFEESMKAGAKAMEFDPAQGEEEYGGGMSSDVQQQSEEQGRLGKDGSGIQKVMDEEPLHREVTDHLGPSSPSIITEQASMLETADSKSHKRETDDSKSLNDSDAEVDVTASELEATATEGHEKAIQGDLASALTQEVRPNIENELTPARQPSGADVKVAGETSPSSPKTNTELNKEADDKKIEVIGMTLTICNKVDGIYVDRPENFKSKQNWEVEYSLVELPHGKACDLYQACKNRRKRALEESDGARRVDPYAALMRRLSRQGAAYRASIDRTATGVQSKDKIVYAQQSSDNAFKASITPYRPFKRLANLDKRPGFRRLGISVKPSIRSPRGMTRSRAWTEFQIRQRAERTEAPRAPLDQKGESLSPVSPTATEHAATGESSSPSPSPVRWVRATPSKWVPLSPSMESLPFSASGVSPVDEPSAPSPAQNDDLGSSTVTERGSHQIGQTESIDIGRRESTPVPVRHMIPEATGAGEGTREPPP